MLTSPGSGTVRRALGKLLRSRGADPSQRQPRRGRERRRHGHRQRGTRSSASAWSPWPDRATPTSRSSSYPTVGWRRRRPRRPAPPFVMATACGCWVSGRPRAERPATSVPHRRRAGISPSSRERTRCPARGCSTWPGRSTQRGTGRPRPRRSGRRGGPHRRRPAAPRGCPARHHRHPPRRVGRAVRRGRDAPPRLLAHRRPGLSGDRRHRPRCGHRRCPRPGGGLRRGRCTGLPLPAPGAGRAIGAAEDPGAELSAWLDTQEQVGAVLAAAGPAARTAWLAGVLGRDLEALVDEVEILTDDQWQRLSDTVRDLAQGVGPDLWQLMGTESRVRAWLVAADRRADTEQFVEARRFDRGHFDTLVEDGTVYARLPLFRAATGPCSRSRLRAHRLGDAAGRVVATRPLERSPAWTSSSSSSSAESPRPTRHPRSGSRWSRARPVSAASSRWSTAVTGTSPGSPRRSTATTTTVSSAPPSMSRTSSTTARRPGRSRSGCGRVASRAPAPWTTGTRRARHRFRRCAPSAPSPSA